ncbi:MAG: hypothetical protein Q7R96_05025 [Nanoarchaeota archaeon]|nr:hypothetical protein [Nanoarchaeota archaeon]
MDATLEFQAKQAYEALVHAVEMRNHRDIAWVKTLYEKLTENIVFAWGEEILREKMRGFPEDMQKVISVYSLGIGATATLKERGSREGRRMQLVSDQQLETALTGTGEQMSAVAALLGNAGDYSSILHKMKIIGEY